MMETILIQTQKACATWRSQGHARFNADLKEQVVNCLNHHSHKQVSDALGITDNTLRTWEKALNQSKQERSCDQQPAFVPISLFSATSANQHSSSLNTLQLTLPNGLSVNMSFQNTAEAVIFIAALNKELHACSI